MELKAIKVTDYKCVLDSEWFSVDNLTALVGKNESGKTAILEAIERLNSVEPDRGAFRKTDFPRLKHSDFENSDGKAQAIHSKWQLTDEEITSINGLAGDKILKSTEVTATKGYDNRLYWAVQIDYAKAVHHLVYSSGLTEGDQKKFTEAGNVTQLFERVRSIDAPTERQSAFLAELESRFPTGSLLREVQELLNSWLPKFVYYSNYDRLPGRVSIDQVIAARANGILDQIQGSKVFLSLLTMVGTTPEQLQSIDTSEDLISKLEGVQSSISRRIFKYWSQNKHLKVRFYFNEASAGDPAPFNSGKVFQTRIENTRHEATINLSERSTGFIWFFSFLVWFSKVQKEHGDNLVVLLDEPGLSLHGRAQFDLLRFVKEELLSKYQVVYTTHSPFMIDPANLLSCRTVEDVITKDDEILGTKVGDDVLSTDSDTVFPLQAALGYDLTQTIFVGEHSLLVEGPSDLLYLQWASDELQRAGRTALDTRWTITPCGGLSKVSSFLALFGGNKLHVAVFTDYGHGERSKVRELKESDLLQAGHVFTAEMYVRGAKEADTEDLLGRNFYCGLVNAAYGLKSAHALPKKRRPDTPERVVLEVKGHFATLPPAFPEFDHYLPAKHLFQLGSNSEFPDKDAALDRFEQLFGNLNALL